MTIVKFNWLNEIDVMSFKCNLIMYEDSVNVDNDIILYIIFII